MVSERETKEWQPKSKPTCRTPHPSRKDTGNIENHSPKTARCERKTGPASTKKRRQKILPCRKQPGHNGPSKSPQRTTRKPLIKVISRRQAKKHAPPQLRQWVTDETTEKKKRRIKKREDRKERKPRFVNRVNGTTRSTKVVAAQSPGSVGDDGTAHPEDGGRNCIWDQSVQGGGGKTVADGLGKKCA